MKRVLAVIAVGLALVISVPKKASNQWSVTNCQWAAATLSEDSRLDKSSAEHFAATGDRGAEADYAEASREWALSVQAVSVHCGGSASTYFNPTPSDAVVIGWLSAARNGHLAILRQYRNGDVWDATWANNYSDLLSLFQTGHCRQGGCVTSLAPAVSASTSPLGAMTVLAEGGDGNPDTFTGTDYAVLPQSSVVIQLGRPEVVWYSVIAEGKTSGAGGNYSYMELYLDGAPTAKIGVWDKANGYTSNSEVFPLLTRPLPAGSHTVDLRIAVDSGQTWKNYVTGLTLFAG